MTIRNRIEKLEQKHKPEDVIYVVIYERDENGVKIDCNTGLPLPPAQPGDRVINLTWGDDND